MVVKMIISSDRPHLSLPLLLGKKRWQNLEKMSAFVGKKLNKLLLIISRGPGPGSSVRAVQYLYLDKYIFIFCIQLRTSVQEEKMSSFGTYSKSQELSETEKEIAEFVVFYDLSCSKRYLIIYLVHFRHVGHSL